jgi:uncharacterized protein (DUF2336 family)
MNSTVPSAEAATRLDERGPSEASRVRAGANPSTPPEILSFLARDRAVTVRASVALNRSTPLQAAHVMARDEEDCVRALIAGKLGALAAGLGPNEQDALRRRTYDALVALAADEAARVRAALADVLKEMPDAPRELILSLARDTEEQVADPIIRLSPLLTEQDLIGLVSDPPASWTALAVARRPDLTAAVSDAMAATASAGAIQILLANRSAAIRETTLDALIARSVEHVDWHEPLVRRPALSPGSARKLSSIVATNLLEVLAARPDLSPGVVAEIASRLSRHLVGKAASWMDSAPRLPRPAPTPPVELLDIGKVSEAMLLRAVQRGDAGEVARLLATAADMPFSAVQRVVSLRSAKALVALVWKAGFSMRVAVPVQALLGRLAPGAVLGAGEGGTFPLSPEEMRWQIDSLQNESRSSGA